jgi:hypothetical protein
MTHVVYLAFVLAAGADTPKLMGTELTMQSCTAVITHMAALQGASGNAGAWYCQPAIKAGGGK